MLIVNVCHKNVGKAIPQKPVQIVRGMNVVAIMRLKMADNLEQYIVIGAIAATVAIFVGTRIFLVFRKLAFSYLHLIRTIIKIEFGKTVLSIHECSRL